MAQPAVPATAYVKRELALPTERTFAPPIMAPKREVAPVPRPSNRKRGLKALLIG
jgi:hypothetical protein